MEYLYLQQNQMCPLSMSSLMDYYENYYWPSMFLTILLALTFVQLVGVMFNQLFEESSIGVYLVEVKNLPPKNPNQNPNPDLEDEEESDAQSLDEESDAQSLDESESESDTEETSDSPPPPLPPTPPHQEVLADVDF